MSDHIVYLDAVSKELEKILNGEKTAILRGAMGRKLPYGRVFPDDSLYFIRNNGEGEVTACAKVKSVINSPKLSPSESDELIKKHEKELNLEPKQIMRFSGKRYLVIIEIEKVEKTAPFRIDKSNYGNMDDWLQVGTIESVKTD